MLPASNRESPLFLGPEEFLEIFTLRGSILHFAAAKVILHLLAKGAYVLLDGEPRAWTARDPARWFLD